MSEKKVISAILILSLFLVGPLMVGGKESKAESNLSPDSGKAKVVQTKESLNDEKGASKTDNKNSDSKASLETSEKQKAAYQVNSAAGTPATTQANGASSQNTPKTIASNSGSTVSRGSSREGKVLTMVATGYDGCYECNKPFYGQPSYIGLPLARGIVAVDPQVIPMGTRLYIEGYGEAIAADQGNAIKGNRIDLFFDSHQEALNYGKKTVKVTIL